MQLCILSQDVIRCIWHPKLNQIAVGCGDGTVKLYYDTKKSIRYLRHFSLLVWSSLVVKICIFLKCNAMIKAVANWRYQSLECQMLLLSVIFVYRGAKLSVVKTRRKVPQYEVMRSTHIITRKYNFSIISLLLFSFSSKFKLDINFLT